MLRKLTATVALTAAALAGGAVAGAPAAASAPTYLPSTEEQAERYVAALERTHAGFRKTTDARIARDARLMCAAQRKGDLTREYAVKVTRSKHVKLTKGQAARVIRAVRAWCA